MKREDRIILAENTVECTKKGEYPYKGEIKKLRIPKKPECIEDMVIKEKLNQDKWFCVKDNIEKIGVTDFIEKYGTENPEKSMIALNFASAKNPGGGFLNGAVAQEECISYVSTLYFSQIKAMDFYYGYNRLEHNPLYSNRIIYSPDIQVFKKFPNGETLEEPINCSIITSPAPNAGVARSRGIKECEIEKVMKERIYKIVSLIAEKNPDCAVLGAYGCGVFRNNREFVLQTFEDAINDIIPANSIDIVFAII